MVAHEVDDLGLARRYRDGDQSAFTEIVERHRDLVYGLVYRMTRVPDEADDVAQEVFLRLHRGLPYFRGEAKLTTWLFRIVLNVVQERQDKKRVPTVPMETTGPDGPRTFDVGAPDRKFDDMVLRDRLDKAMAGLPERSRFVLAAHYLKGVQYEDLADVLNVPVGTVKTLIFRAKRQLRELMVAEGSR